MQRLRRSLRGAVGIAPSAPQMLAGMKAGWTQSLERLEALVGRTRDQPTP